MRNLVFVLWMIGFPLADSIATYFDTLASGKTFQTDGLAALIMLAIWVWIGSRLYEKKP